jgi:hypothetical protein
MSSYYTLRRVPIVRTDVSEEHMASINRATRICKLGTTLSVTSNRSKLLRNITFNQRVSISSPNASIATYC